MTRLTSTEIEALLTSYVPYILIDRVEDLDPPHRIVAIKNVSRQDHLVRGRSGTYAVFPNSLILDAMAQAASLLFLQDPEYSGRLAVLSQVSSFHWLRGVEPGDQLRLEIEVLTIKPELIRFLGRAVVDGRVVAEGEFDLGLAPKPSRPTIHPTAFVHASALLGKDVVVGPFSIVGEHVEIGDGTILEAHVMVEKWTKIGKDCHIHVGCVIGSDAQDVKYGGEKTWVVIGDRNEIREYVTINRSTGKDTITEIGSDNIFLTHVHIPHNCKIGNHVIIANMTNLGGHTIVEDKVVIGGMTGIHQFVRIGQGAMVGAYTRLPQDVPPFTLCEGNPAHIRGLNLVGMKRRGVTRQGIQEVKEIFKTLYLSDKNTSQALQDLAAMSFETSEAKHLVAFVSQETSRGILKKDAVESDESSHSDG
jgi:UDP-N-acetylglucosamine acyltransferase